MWPWLAQIGQDRAGFYSYDWLERLIGAFVLHPMNEGTTRLIVRTRGDGRPSVRSVALAPLTLLVFEPAHFISSGACSWGSKSVQNGRRLHRGMREGSERRSHLTGSSTFS